MAGANNDTAKWTRDFPMMMMRLMFGFEPSDHGTLIAKPSVQLSFDFDG
jgi:hypothetical protein